MPGLDFSDQVDFYEHILGQTGDFYGGAGGRGLTVGLQIRAVDSVHCCKVVEVFQENRCFDGAIEAAAALFEYGFEIFEDAGRLLSDASRNNLLGFRIKGDLAGSENKVARANGLGIGSDGGGGFAGSNDCFAHGSIVKGNDQDARSAQAPKDCATHDEGNQPITGVDEIVAEGAPLIDIEREERRGYEPCP